MAFTSLGLDDRLVQGILATGYTAPTEIQSRAIPEAISGKDIIGRADTGTGKTAAFVLPILHRLALSGTRTHHSKALILTPTRELAQQIDEAIKEYGRFLSVRSIALYGGMNIFNQIKNLRKGIDIIIATPGRLLDHLQKKTVQLNEIEVLVLDEADRMLDMGFIDDVKHIIETTPASRQTLLFSATLSADIRRLIKSIQKDPVKIEIGEQRNPAKTITQHFYSIPDNQKNALLLHMLQDKQLDSVLVFSRTKARADSLSHSLHKSGIKSIAIHSDRTQAQRQRALEGFKRKHFTVLVATDVAARGIDVDGISHVINFDIPFYAEDYIHRIGRTGRAGATGDAVTFVGRSEMKYLKNIERFINRRFVVNPYPGFVMQNVDVQSASHRSSETERDSEQPFQRQRHPSSGRPVKKSAHRPFPRQESGRRFPRKPHLHSQSQEQHGFQKFFPKKHEKAPVREFFSSQNSFEDTPRDFDWKKLIQESDRPHGGKHKTVRKMVNRKKRTQ